MSLFKAAKALEVLARKTGNTQVVKTMTIDITDLPKFADAIEKANQGLQLNEAAITKNGVSPLGDGSPMVPYAVKSRQPSGSATVYYNGKVVLAGALADFDFPG